MEDSNVIKVKPQLVTKPGSTSRVDTRSNTNRGSIAVLTRDNKRLIAKTLPIILLPNGRPVGRVTLEGRLRAWIRRVSFEKHYLRCDRAWTINKGVLLQLVDHGIDLIAYDSGPDRYTITLEGIISQSRMLPGFGPESEDVYSLPTAEWQTAKR